MTNKQRETDHIMKNNKNIIKNRSEGDKGELTWRKIEHEEDNNSTIQKKHIFKKGR